MAQSEPDSKNIASPSGDENFLRNNWPYFLSAGLAIVLFIFVGVLLCICLSMKIWQMIHSKKAKGASSEEKDANSPQESLLRESEILEGGELEVSEQISNGYSGKENKPSDSSFFQKKNMDLEEVEAMKPQYDILKLSFNWSFEYSINLPDCPI